MMAAKKSKKAKPKKPTTTSTGSSDAKSKVQIVGEMLQRPNGCTTKEVLAATGWPSVSMPQQAKAAGLTLRKVKGDDGTRYYGDPK